MGHKTRLAEQGTGDDAVPARLSGAVQFIKLMGKRKGVRKRKGVKKEKRGQVFIYQL